MSSCLVLTGWQPSLTPAVLSPGWQLSQYFRALLDFSTYMCDGVQWAQIAMQEVSLKMRNGFFTVKVTEHWHRFPREVMESASLETFKSHLYVVLEITSGWPCLSMGAWSRWSPEVPSLETVLGFCKISKVISRIDWQADTQFLSTTLCFHMPSGVKT